jgi:hypothetical protein
VAALGLFATRVPVLAIGLLAVWLVGTWPPPTSEALWRVSAHEIRNLLARWDTFWYYSIATEGYHWDATRFQHENVVFFPLYPLLMRWGGRLLGVGPLTAGLLVSLGSFTGAVVLLYRLAIEDLGEAQAGPAILLFATYPFALFFSAVYTESLFLFVTVGAFYAMRRDRILIAALLGVAAGLTRPNGCWLALPLLWMAWERTAAPVSLPRRALALCAALAPGVGTAAYSAYLFVRFGDALAWMHGQAAWGLPLALRFGATDGVVFTRAPSEFYTDVVTWTFNIVAFAVAVAAIKPIYRRFGPPYALWVAFTIFPPVFTHLFMSLGRFTSVLFPLFFWLATIVPRQKLWRVAGCFAFIQAIFAILFFLWRPVV